MRGVGPSLILVALWAAMVVASTFNTPNAPNVHEPKVLVQQDDVLDKLVRLYEEKAGKEIYASNAARLAVGREAEVNDTSSHDVGFVTFGTFGNGYKLWAKSDRGKYMELLTTAAHSLAKRYNPVVGMTRSWGDIDDNTSFEVIIDNLLNLELLFWVGYETMNYTLLEMAISHVDKTAEYWLRSDFSTYHLVVFNPNNGSVISRSGTPQGMAVNSTWARGQAWGVYGFTMAYRYVQEPRFLEYARQVSEYWLAANNADLVPNWDFNAPLPTYRDTSSAAIVASGFIELATYTQNPVYRELAQGIVATLASDAYLAPENYQAILQRNGHDCVLAGCTVIETDYYFLEAIRRLKGADF
ncbi:uncharacterized protein MONBRDRAFT_23330 [Monosiga brevicollis MX1]|uniref:Glycosyl hydrolase family 88 n=1 Tax=Monosiga brevicollis TaxID=81824 RepID=A9UT27_MONBE|nr:uncharacterized protein MONBRDRAFT_23330 [Monosiga brevicollis MX1]EDQ91422.1 predicted protein [Monosiga brevicollis MX1]|eukprot:XP_001743844.1 hypothetical protein [Monosiga brevicollis MX1]